MACLRMHTGRSEDAIERTQNQTLTSTSFQHVNGDTVMKFVRPLNPTMAGKLVRPLRSVIVRLLLENRLPSGFHWQAIGQGVMTVLSAYGSSVSFEKHVSKGANRYAIQFCFPTVYCDS